MPRTNPIWNKLTPGNRRDRPVHRVAFVGGSLSKMTQRDIGKAIARCKERRATVAQGGNSTAADLEALRDLDLLISGYTELLHQMVKPSREVEYRGKQ